MDLPRFWCRLSFVSRVRNAFPERTELLCSKRALCGLRDDSCPYTPLSTAFGGRRLDSLPLLNRTTERLGYALLESMKHPLAQEWKLSAAIHHTLDEL